MNANLFTQCTEIYHFLYRNENEIFDYARKMKNNTTARLRSQSLLCEEKTTVANNFAIYIVFYPYNYQIAEPTRTYLRTLLGLPLVIQYEAANRSIFILLLAEAMEIMQRPFVTNLPPILHLNYNNRKTPQDYTNEAAHEKFRFQADNLIDLMKSIKTSVG
jgi:hypothetical protein